MRLEKTNRGFTIDAADLGSLFDISAEEVRRMMREGAIVTRTERGEGEDRGRFRLSFLGPGRRVQLIVDDRGEVLRRARTSQGAPRGTGRLPGAAR